MATFTNGDDVVQLTVEENFTVQDGLDGFDIVTLAPEGSEVGVRNIESVIGSDKDDELRPFSGTPVKFDGRDGTDTVTLLQPNLFVDLTHVEKVVGSSGDDGFTMHPVGGVAASAQVDGGKGVDFVRVVGDGDQNSFLDVYLSNVENAFADSSARFVLGEGSQGVSVVSSIETSGYFTEVVMSGMGGTVNRAYVENVNSVRGSDVRDVVQVGPTIEKSTFIDLGAGVDRIEMVGRGDHVVYATNTEAVLGSQGDDVLLVGGQTPTSMSIDLAGGRDSVTVLSTSGEYRSLLVSNVEQINAGDGNETVTVRTAAKALFVDGGSGYDELLLSNANNSVTASSVEFVRGGSGIDRIDASSLFGTYVDGGAGGDVIRTGDADDFILGGLGKDVMTGGAGADRFRFVSVADSDLATRDIITDFRPGEDKLEFLDVHVAGKEAVSQFDFLGSVQKYTGSEFQATGHAQAVFLDTTDQLFLDVDGNGSMDMRMTLQGVDGSQLSLADFGWYAAVP